MVHNSHKLNNTSGKTIEEIILSRQIRPISQQQKASGPRIRIPGCIDRSLSSGYLAGREKATTQSYEQSFFIDPSSYSGNPRPGTVNDIIRKPTTSESNRKKNHTSSNERSFLHEFSQLKASSSSNELNPSSMVSPIELNNLLEKCNILEKKIDNIQNQVSSNTPSSFSASTIILDKSSTETHNPKYAAEINFSVAELGTNIARLDRVFFDLASEEQRQKLAILKIVAHAKGYLVRKRYKKMCLSLSRWRENYCVQFFESVKLFHEKQNRIEKNIQFWTKRRVQSLLQSIATAWKSITKLNLPKVIIRRQIAETKFQRVITRKIQAVLEKWKLASHGPRSRKKIQKEHHERCLNARRRLEAMQRYTVISVDMIQEEVRKQIARSIRERHHYYMIHTHFYAWLNDLYMPLLSKRHQAIKHYCNKLVNKFFFFWLTSTKAKQDEIDHLKRKTQSNDRLEKRFNMKKVDYYAEIQNLRRHFKGWRKYIVRNREVRLRFEKITNRSLSKILIALRIRSQYQRYLRQTALSEWKNYCHRIYNIPFHAWYIYATHRHERRKAQQTLINAYQRRCSRRVKYNYFRSWRHQAMYGQVNGVHTRVELITALEQQKKYCLELEENAGLYKETIITLQKEVETYTALSHQKENQLEEQFKETENTRFAMHNAEQQIARLQAILDAVHEIHPVTIERIQNMESGSSFVTNGNLVSISRQYNQKNDKNKEAATPIPTDIKQVTGSDNHDQSFDRGSETELLKRLKWVLSRIEIYQDEIEMKSKSKNVVKDTDTEPLSTESNQLYALLDFIQSGNSAALLPENTPDVFVDPQDLDYRRKSLMARRINQSVKQLSSSDSSITNDSSTSSNMSSFKPISLIKNKKKWGDFLIEITAQFPPKRNEALKDRLMKRVAHTKEVQLHISQQEKRNNEKLHTRDHFDV